MTPLVERVLAKAFHRAALGEANAAIDAARDLRATAGERALSYELVLPGFAVDEFLTTKALPKLVYFLDCRGLSLSRTPAVFVSLFTPTGLFFVEAAEVVAELGAAAGLGVDELRRRYGADGTGAPKLLGGPAPAHE